MIEKEIASQKPLVITFVSKKSIQGWQAACQPWVKKSGFSHLRFDTCGQNRYNRLIVIENLREE